MSDSRHQGLPLGFGTATATFVVISSMVGVGVLTTSGKMVASLGSNQLMLVTWVIGGLIALCGALSLAEMASAWPGAGGEYVILRESFGPLIAFLCGWATLIVGFAAPIAASSSAFSLYLLAPVELAPESAYWIRQATASLAIVVFSIIHCAGHRRAVQAQGLVTFLELLIFVAFVIGGLIVGSRGSGWQHLSDRPPITLDRLGLMAYSLVFVAYSYTGWNGSAFLAGEVKDPAKTLPRSILLGTFAVMSLYVGINLVYALALSADEIQAISRTQGENAVVPIAEIAARRLFGEVVAIPLSLAIALILLATLSAYLLTGPRVMFAMARAGQLPEPAGRLASTTGTPTIATLWLAAGSLVLLWTGSFDQVVVYAGVGLTIASMFVIASIYVLRVRYPDRPRPFRVPGYPVIPAIYLLGSTALLVGVSIEDPFATLTALLSIGAGIPIYLLGKKRHH